VIGADTSFLVALALREHPAHEAAWELFEDEVRGRTASVAIAAQALAEFAHVVTDGRRFERPLPMAEALDICEQWWTSQECRPAVADADVGILFLAWMREHRLDRRRLLDTLLTATYHRAGVQRLATTNWRDFACFGVFELEVL
jgi:predicted nucleic acid-binding protein